MVAERAIPLMREMLFDVWLLMCSKFPSQEIQVGERQCVIGLAQEVAEHGT